MQQYNNDIELIVSFKSLFRRKRRPKVGDVGIYKDVLTINTSNEGTHQLFYDIFAKVRVIAIYEDLAELEIVEVTNLNAGNQEISSVINANIPKFLSPNRVKWEIND